ncbi:glycosyltransferase family 4 protein [Clostridium boliviensis]|uniref:Glycosyltransferase family 4 protein n=1 Tax=Clostridium boliviensis TaxID=318465 RepID=A0ABU4GPT1_9CLOT|nr:glycosyltransferase family 4 protein [Clostridium boliviensis]MDW2799655.1 glycosyltransferase family 4 protein [Clostridium boliviensis]
MKSQKKALLVTTVSGFVPQFEMSNVYILRNMGYEIHYATNYNTPSYGNDNRRLKGTGIIQHQIDFVRSPFKIQNIKVYFQLKQLMIDEHFDLVHCHTPMGSVIARIAAHATKTYPVIYTAHGFHFFKGAPYINWFLYYPVEKLLSYFTDQLICINQEDYERSKKHFHAKHLNYIPGVGLDINKEQKAVDINRKKQELGLHSDKFILLSSGELIKRKNHETIIRAIRDYKDNYASVPFHYIICGQGVLEGYLKDLADSLKVSNYISFLGYRNDMMEILQIADLFIFPSYQEGLPMALLEAMAYGLPVICSDIRGSRDLMGKCEKDTMNVCDGGILIKHADDVKSFSKAIYLILQNKELLNEMSSKNKIKVKNFSQINVNEAMINIYNNLLS